MINLLPSQDKHYFEIPISKKENEKNNKKIRIEFYFAIE